jgi:Tol biopolymer transport system component
MALLAVAGAGPRGAAGVPRDSGVIAFATYHRGSGIFVINAEGSGRRRLTRDPVADEFPSWSADGNRIAFTDLRGNSAEIYVVAADGSGLRGRTRFGGDIDPSWSPSGKQIAFSSSRDGNPEVSVMAANGSRQQRLTVNPAIDADPSWSPDGKQISFVSKRDGNFEIYVMASDGTPTETATTRST